MDPGGFHGGLGSRLSPGRPLDVRKPQASSAGLALSLVLLFSAAGIRYSALLLVVASALPLLVFMAYKKEITPARKAILRFSAVAAVLGTLAVGYDYYTYHRDPGWVDFKQFFKQHFDLNEARKPVYDSDTRPVFDSIGWSKNDLDLFTNWYFLDEDTYSVEKLKKLNGYFSQVKFNKSTDPVDGGFFRTRSSKCSWRFSFIPCCCCPKKRSGSSW